MPRIRHALETVLLAAASLVAIAAGAADLPPPREVGKDLRCPVCRMYPARYPAWMAQAVFRDGTMQAFDSPADLFRFLQDRPKYDARPSPPEIGAIYLNDHGRRRWIEARQAFFVHGSRAKGPMNGPDLPAFDTREAARAFAEKQGGKVLAFAEVTPAVIAELGGSGHHHH